MTVGSVECIGFVGDDPRSRCEMTHYPVGWSDLDVSCVAVVTVHVETSWYGHILAREPYHSYYVLDGILHLLFLVTVDVSTEVVVVAGTGSMSSLISH